MAGPKLLDKKVVNAEVATQRKQQIDLGLSMSKKVDAVRETLLEEESNLEKFRRETIARVQAEIDSYIRQKDTLKDEIRVLEERRIQALVPVTAEWEEVRYAQSLIEKDKVQLEQKSLSLIEREKSLQPLEKQALKDTAIAKELKTRATQSYAEASATLEDAKKYDIRTRNEVNKLLSEAESKERGVLAKEKSILAREIVSLERATELDERETDLANRELILKDRYQTLIEAQKHINNQQ